MNRYSARDKLIIGGSIPSTLREEDSEDWRSIRESASSIYTNTEFAEYSSRLGTLGAVAYLLQFGKMKVSDRARKGRRSISIVVPAAALSFSVAATVFSMVVLAFDLGAEVPMGPVWESPITVVCGMAAVLLFMFWSVSKLDRKTFTRFSENASRLQFALLVSVTIAAFLILLMGVLQAVFSIVLLVHEWNISRGLFDDPGNARVYGENNFNILQSHAPGLASAGSALLASVMVSVMLKFAVSPQLQLKSKSAKSFQYFVPYVFAAIALVFFETYLLFLIWVVSGDFFAAFAVISVVLILPVTVTAKERRKQLGVIRDIRRSLFNASIVCRDAANISESKNVGEIDGELAGALSSAVLDLKESLLEDTLVFPDFAGRVYRADVSIVEVVEYLGFKLGIHPPGFRGRERIAFVDHWVGQLSTREMLEEYHQLLSRLVSRV